MYAQLESDHAIALCSQSASVAVPNVGGGSILFGTSGLVGEDEVPFTFAFVITCQDAGV